MPEGPELRLAALLVRSIGRRVSFGGAVVKSDVSVKNPDVTWNCVDYRIDAESRGKEMKMTLTDVDNADHTLSILFHFGMSGKFELTSADTLPKHSHLRFFSKDGLQTLSFVDPRRFGRWFPGADWDPARGPCVVTETAAARDRVLERLEEKAFDSPICELLLDQRFFNGVGNYLRAEALFQLGTAPFERARTALGAASAVGDVFDLIRGLAEEVIEIGIDEGGGYFSESKEKWDSGFGRWLRCYGRDGMRSMKDRKGRTIWFLGNAGPLAPKGDGGEGAKTRRKMAKGEGDEKKFKVEKDKVKKIKSEKDDIGNVKMEKIETDLDEIKTMKVEKDVKTKGLMRKSKKRETKIEISDRRRSKRLSNDKETL